VQGRAIGPSGGPSNFCFFDATDAEHHIASALSGLADAANA
jgi:hypothetical protein